MGVNVREAVKEPREVSERRSMRKGRLELDEGRKSKKSEGVKTETMNVERLTVEGTGKRGRGTEG